MIDADRWHARLVALQAAAGPGIESCLYHFKNFKKVHSTLDLAYSAISNPLQFDSYLVFISTANLLLSSPSPD